MSDELPEYLCVRLNGERTRSLRVFLKAEGLEKALFRDVFKKEGVELKLVPGDTNTYLHVHARTPAAMESAKNLVDGYRRKNPDSAPYMTSWAQQIR